MFNVVLLEFLQRGRILFTAMKDELRQHILTHLGRELPGIEFVLDAFQEVKASKNQLLVIEGEVCRECYFIVKGCIQTSTSNRNGHVSTIDLGFEGDWRTAMHSFINGIPSNEQLMTIEACQLLSINRDKFQHLVDTIPPFEYIYKELLEKAYTQSVERIQSLMTMDGLDRLKWLLSIHPLIFTRLSNRLIASYLGLDPATLSRLKARL
ncbi:MAG: Crp/Fnr family transcriptional regulator [Bacteroidota bacterium]